MRGSGFYLLLLVLAGCVTSKPATKKTASAKKHPVKLEPGAAWWPATGEIGQDTPLRRH
jgi:hypothetical protein